MKHYVLFTHVDESNNLEGQVAVVGAVSAMKAFDVAIGNYRKTNGLPVNIHIHCRKLKEYDTEKEANEFYDWFLEEVRKDQKMKRKGGVLEDDH